MEMVVGLIGCGRMGKAYGLNLLKAGYELLVYDVDPQALKDLTEQGAEAVAPKELAKKSQYVLIALPRSEIVEELLTGSNGIINDMQKGATVIDMSTTSPETTVKLAEAFSKIGVDFLDAPVSGHPEKAKEGTLTIIVGGEKSVFEAAREPIFQKLGKNIFHAGPSGTGQALKLVNNLMYNINRLAMCEGFVMGVKAGIDPDVMLQVISLSSGASYAMNKNGPALLKHDFESGESSLRLACKTLKLIVDYGHELGSCLMLGNIAKQIYDSVRLKYGMELSPTAAVQFYEEAVQPVNQAKKS